MKRISNVIFFFTAAVLLVAGCEKETVLSLSRNSVSFTESGGSETVNLSVNKEWKAVSSSSWCSVSAASGIPSDGRAVISILCETNKTYDDRSCSVTVSSGELSKTINVTQAQSHGVVVEKTAYVLDSKAQNVEIEVKANEEYRVGIEGSCSWMEIVSTKSLSSGKIILGVQENTTYDNRLAEVTVSGSKAFHTVQIEQKPRTVLDVGQTEYSVDYHEQTVNLSVSSNVDYKISVDPACSSWVTAVSAKGLVSNTAALHISENLSGKNRDGKVTVETSDGELSVEVKLSQGSEIEEGAEGLEQGEDDGEQEW